MKLQTVIKIEMIEKLIRELDGEDFAAFSRWFEQLQAHRFDQEVAGDAKACALDRLAEKALSNFRDGRSSALFAVS